MYIRRRGLSLLTLLQSPTHRYNVVNLPEATNGLGCSSRGKFFPNFHPLLAIALIAVGAQDFKNSTLTRKIRSRYAVFLLSLKSIEELIWKAT
jgi:hypothetical protein